LRRGGVNIQYRIWMSDVEVQMRGMGGNMKKTPCGGYLDPQRSWGLTDIEAT